VRPHPELKAESPMFRLKVLITQYGQIDKETITETALKIRISNETARQWERVALRFND
jgi:hypothetical protein